MSNMALKMDNVIFDWRLYEQQGLPSYLHRHDQSKWVQQCELQFLKKMMDESSFTPANVEAKPEETRARSAASHRNVQKHNHHHHHHGHHHHHHHSQQAPQNQAQQPPFAATSLNYNSLNTMVQAGQSSQPQQPNRCEFCGRPYCDQPNHPACKQQHAQCNQQREQMQRDQQQQQKQQQQHRSRSAAAQRSSRSRSMERSQTALHNYQALQDGWNNGQSMDEEQHRLREQLHTLPQFVLSTGGGGSFECVGGVRKAGFLSVKKWLLRRRQHVELARKRGWKCYWACLKGTTLIFYHIGYDRDATDDCDEDDDQVHRGNASRLRSRSKERFAACAECVRSNRCAVAQSIKANQSIYENVHCAQSSASGWCDCDCHRNVSTDSVRPLNRSMTGTSQPKHLILVDGCIVQPIPEHPKREHVFCLSSAVGDAYLFQCPCDNELLNWVNAIQSACGAAIARSRGRVGAVARLTTEIGFMQSRLDRAARRRLSLEQQLGALLEQVHAIGGVEALANAVAAGNQNTVTTGNRSSADCNRLLAALRDLQSQLSALELQLEREHCEQFRLRCYVSSMQHGGGNTASGGVNASLELPNPKMLLSHVSKQTKHVLNRLGIFNVSSLHAYTCARSPALLNSLLLNLSQQMQQSASNATKAAALYNSADLDDDQRRQGEDDTGEESTLFRVAGATSTTTSATAHLPSRRGSQVRLQVIVPPPGPTVHDLLVDGGRTVEQLIDQLLGERRAQLAAQWRRLMRAQHLPSSEFFVCCKLVSQQGYFVPDAKLRIDRLPPIQHMRLLRKRTLRLQLQRSSTQCMFGFSVEAHCLTDSNSKNDHHHNHNHHDHHQQHENAIEHLKSIDPKQVAGRDTTTGDTNVLRAQGRLQVLVCKVEPESAAARQGLRKGDELLQLNGAAVADLDMMFVECVLQEELQLNLVLRCARIDQQQQQLMNTKSDDNAMLFADLDIYDTFNSIQSIDRSPLRPHGRSYSGGNESQVLMVNSNYNEHPNHAPPRRHSEHVLDSQHLANYEHESLADDYIDSLVCPPPPQDAALSDELIDKLIIPKPDQLDRKRAIAGSNSMHEDRTRLDSVVDLTENLIKSVQQVKAQLVPSTTMTTTATTALATSTFTNATATTTTVPNKGIRTGRRQTSQLITTVVEVQVHNEPPPDEPTPSKAKLALHQRRKSEELPARPRDLDDAPLVTEIQTDLHFDTNQKKHSLTDCEKTHRVICEMLDTEITYVSHLQRFKQMYLKPIREQNILSSIDSLSLFGPTDDVLEFQNEFMQMLQGVVEQSLPPDHDLHLRLPEEYASVLIRLSKLFLFHTPQFRLYSVFCSAHSKAQKLLFAKESPNIELQEFVKRTSNGEKANSLETFLIKPIQRILKYPLLLQQLRDLSPMESVENDHLSAALKAMEKVAEHINEMQRINEEFGHVLDSLQRTHFKSTRQLISVGPTQLLYYDQVFWQNAADYLGKLKKSADLYSMCFVFCSSVVFFCMERNKQKKKTNMRDLLDAVRYQILMPINEVQVRATRQDVPPLPSSTANASTGSGPDETVPQFQWELIHLKCSLTSVNTQKRTEKVFQLGNRSSTFRNVFLRTIRRLIRESVRNMPLPSKSAAHDALDKPDLVGEGQMEVLAQMQQKQPVGEVIQKVDQMSLIQLLEKQLQLRYFNASTLTRHLEETNGFDDEDKSCASEK